MSSVSDDRLRRLLGTSELATLRKRLRRRFERCATGEAPERFRISGLSAGEYAALAALLGRSPHFSASIDIDVGSVDDVVRRSGVAASFRAALEQLDGPIVSLADERTRVRSQWSEVVDACRHSGLKAFLQAPAGIGLLKRCSRSDSRAAMELCLHAEAVLLRLPTRSLTRAQLAASVLGDAHALDGGRAEATIVLAVLRHSAESAGALATDPPSESSDDLPDKAREVWASAGVLVNELARPVLFLNLPADAGRSVAQVAGEPGYVSLRTLVRSAPVWSAAGRDIYVCENPNVVAIAADELGSRSSPLVCTEGMPAAAQRLLLTQLSAAGARLRYHGDFDWAGLRIGNYLMRELAVQPWRFRAVDYLEAIGVAALRRHPLHGADVLASWDETLTPIMRENQIAIAEEAIAHLLIADLDAL
jgi:uncharacterized protein (TIGR02679 family)